MSSAEATKTNNIGSHFSHHSSNHLVAAPAAPAASQLCIVGVGRSARGGERGRRRWLLAVVAPRNRNWTIRVVYQGRATVVVDHQHQESCTTVVLCWANRVRSHYPRCASFVLMCSIVICITSTHRRRPLSAMTHSEYQQRSFNCLLCFVNLETFYTQTFQGYSIIFHNNHHSIASDVIAF